MPAGMWAPAGIVFNSLLTRAFLSAIPWELQKGTFNVQFTNA
jgi:hypothetical protein